jgi:hypothetical protein
MKQKFNDKQIERLLRDVGPKTHFEDFAEEGHLMEYLNEFLKDRYTNDMPFRMEMFELFLKHSKEPIPEVEEYYLRFLSYTINYFMEHTAKWRTQEHLVQK